MATGTDQANRIYISNPKVNSWMSSTQPAKIWFEHQSSRTWKIKEKQVSHED